MTKAEIILASKSVIRKKILKQAGIEFSVKPSNIDEKKIKEKSSHGPYHQDLVARDLAVEKARVISEQHPKDFVIGADQILYFEGQILSKAKDMNEAFEALKMLQGKDHHLISAVCLMKGADVLWEITDTVTMSMKPLSDKEIKSYLERADRSVLNSVGCYQLENLGIRLFENIRGDYFSILGLPLLRLLNALEKYAKVKL